MSKKKYLCIVKIGSQSFHKYHVNDLVKFSKWLDHKHSDWRFFNVFRYQPDHKGEQLGSFTCKRRPAESFPF